MFKELANLGNIMRRAQEMSGRMQEATQKLRTERVSAAAGGGLVKVEMNGLGQMLKLELDPDLLAGDAREMIEDLVPAAVNEAQQKARELHSEMMRSLTAGLELPGLDDALAGFTGLNG
jgi:DNA-binding YbaB/EbfC family protein